MLQNMRDNSRGIIAYILIGVLVVFFALSGVEALFNWQADVAAAEVNGEKISTTQLDRAIENQKQQIMNYYGNQVPEEFMSNDYLRKPVLENLIRRSLLLQYSDQAGMTVSEAQLTQQIANEAGFKNEQGVFDNQKYLQFLAMSGFTHSSYLKALKEDVMLNQLQQSLTTSAFTLPYEMENAVALGFQSRDFSYFQIPVAQLRDSITVSEEEINAEYQANAPVYTADEQVAVDYVELKIDDLMKSVSVTEDQVRKQYEQNLANFVATPERQAAHILIEGDKPELLKEVGDKIAAGEDFATLAKTYSEDPGSKELGGDLGYTSGDTFPKEFEDALAKLKVGEVSAPVKTEAGTHLIKLLAERGNTAPAFEEQRAAIEEQLKRGEAENIFIAQLDKLKEETYNAEKLADVAPGLGLEVKNTGLFSRKSGKDLAANPKFVEAAFSSLVLQDGNASDPVEIESMHVVVIKKTEHKPSHLKPLAEVQGDIVNLLKDKKSRELLAQKGQEYIKQLQQGSAFADVAKSAGYEVKEAKAATRGAAEVDVDVLRHVFTMAKPTADKASVSGVTVQNGDYVVVNLTAVNPGSKANMPAEQQSAITAQLNNMAGQQSFSNFQKVLEDTAEIVRN